MRKISIKNYIIAAAISVLTFVVVGYFAFWYKETKEYDQNDSVMTGYLLEIGEDGLIDNLSNYLLDNPNTVLYISYGKDLSLKNFESEFKEFINKNNIKQSFIYIDLNRVEDKNFMSEFKNSFLSEELKNKNINIEKQPNLFIFKDGEVESILYYIKSDINITDIKLYLENEEVIDND